MCDRCTEVNIQVTQITDQASFKVPICLTGADKSSNVWEALMKWNFLIFNQEIFAGSIQQLPCKENNPKNSDDRENSIYVDSKFG